MKRRQDKVTGITMYGTLLLTNHLSSHTLTLVCVWMNVTVDLLQAFIGVECVLTAV